jgi:DNA mismatch repair protein MutS
LYSSAHKKLTPVMRQYKEAKEAFPDAILFFRLGDFYEMFNDDAVVAARELSLTLTSRNKGSPDAVPMAGVPYHSAHGYVAKLIARGFKVAICEQMGDPSKMKGIVPRKVVRVLTPGLLTDDGQLDAQRNNFLCAVEGAAEGPFGLARLDLSTGDLAACSVPTSALLLAELARAEPSEALVPAGLDEIAAALAQALPRCFIRRDGALGDDELRKHLDEGVAAPLYDDARSQHTPDAVRAAARALRFAAQNLPDATLPVRRVGHHDVGATMHLDETAQEHLELVRGPDGTRAGSLLAAIDETVTAAGARLLRRQLLAPLSDVAAIRRRLDAVDAFLQHARAREELREALRRVGDIERLTVRTSLREATPRDLGGLRDSLTAAPVAHAAIRSMLERATAGDRGLLDLDVSLEEPLRERLAAALVDSPPAHARDGGIFRRGFDDELDKLATLRDGGAAVIRELEQKLRADTHITSLKIRYTRGFGWYIEVTKAHLDKVPAAWRRRQTLTGAERYLSEELEDLAANVESAEERHGERESALWAELCSAAAARAEPLGSLARAMAQWDVSAALAETAHVHGYARPEVDEGDRVQLADARHPVVERSVPRGQFVPNDVDLDLGGEHLWLITGPNMAGKSTLMRQVALAVILAQTGSFVPARQARVGVCDRVLSRVGASDNLARGESTFMVEMRETAAILRHATRRSLVILDEIGRGTSTFDGLAIAWAVAEHLHDRVRCRAMFATHYHQLTELGGRCEGLANHSVSAREHDGDVVFLHRLTRGPSSRSYGIAVARLAGLPESVLARASALLGAMEAGKPIAGGPTEVKQTRQLDLFERAATPALGDAERDVLAELRAAETNRMTPLDALVWLEGLKKRLEG